MGSQRKHLLLRYLKLRVWSIYTLPHITSNIQKQYPVPWKEKHFPQTRTFLLQEGQPFRFSLNCMSMIWRVSKLFPETTTIWVGSHSQHEDEPYKCLTSLETGCTTLKNVKQFNKAIKHYDSYETYHLQSTPSSSCWCQFAYHKCHHPHKALRVRRRCNWEVGWFQQGNQIQPLELAANHHNM